MSRSRAKGTAAESMVVAFLRRLWPGAERRALSGAKDRGDVAGTPGVCWEVKSVVKLSIPEALRETEVERINSASDLGFLVIKPVGYGAKKVDQWPVVTTLGEIERILRALGYGERRVVLPPRVEEP